MFTPRKLALDAIPRDDLLVDWEHIYLLGWYGPTGNSYLTTWWGGPDSLYLRVVVTGPVKPFGPPLWDAPAPHKGIPWLPPLHPWQEFTLHLVGPTENARDKAGSLGGVEAFGWYIPLVGFQRGWHRPG